MILCASVVSNKSLMEEATKCLFRTSLRSTHSTRTALRVAVFFQTGNTAAVTLAAQHVCERTLRLGLPSTDLRPSFRNWPATGHLENAGTATVYTTCQATVAAWKILVLQ